MSAENLVEWELAEETKVLGENLPQCHFIHHKSHMTLPGIEPREPRRETGDYSPELGRVIAEAVSRWLPTAASRVQSRVWLSGICGGQSGVGVGFLRVLRSSLPFIPPNSPSSQTPGAGTTGQWMADVPSGPSLDSTPPLCKLKKNAWAMARPYVLLHGQV
jgi:hypothetical protein